MKNHMEEMEKKIFWLKWFLWKFHIRHDKKYEEASK